MKNTITATDRKLTELTDKELTEIFESNKYFQNLVFEWLSDDAYRFIDEVISYFDSARPSYELDYYGGYFKVNTKYYPEFLRGYINLCDDLCGLRDQDKMKALAERLNSRVDFYIDAYNGWADISAEKYDLLEAWFESGIDELTAAIVNFAEKEYEAAYDTNYAADYFKNFFVEVYDDDYIITETGEIYAATYRLCK